jgi:hypothetical protein
MQEGAKCDWYDGNMKNRNGLEDMESGRDGPIEGATIERREGQDGIMRSLGVNVVCDLRV